MNKHQAGTWNLLIVLVIVVLVIGFWSDWFELLLNKITTFHPTSLDFNPTSQTSFQQNGQDVTPGKTSSSGTKGFDIPLLGGGSVHTNANDLQAAINNVSGTGNVTATNFDGSSNA